MRLAAVTEPSSMPLLPSSLYTTNKVLTGILDILEEVSNDTSVAASEVSAVYILCFACVIILGQ